MTPSTRSRREVAGRRAALLHPRTLVPLRHPVASAVSGIVGVGIVIAAGLFITSGAGGIAAADLTVVQQISTDHTPVLDWVALFIDWLFGPRAGILVIALTVAVVWATSRRAVVAVTFLVTALSPWVAAETIKTVVQRDRPDPLALVDPLIVEPHSFSFPSGHTAFAAGLALAFVVISRGSRRHVPIIAVAVAFTVAVAASRVWVGVHYPTDVIASMVLACSVTAVVLPVLLHVLERRRPSRPDAQVATTHDREQTLA